MTDEEYLLGHMFDSDEDDPLGEDEKEDEEDNCNDDGESCDDKLPTPDCNKNCKIVNGVCVEEGEI